MKSPVIAIEKFPKTDFRRRRNGTRTPLVFSFTFAAIAEASGTTMEQVTKDKHRGYFDPDNLRSVAVYIARRIFLREFK